MAASSAELWLAASSADVVSENGDWQNKKVAGRNGLARGEKHAPGFNCSD
jgi:hypothetical protein